MSLYAVVGNWSHQYFRITCVSSSGSSLRVGGGEKHEMYATTFGGHLFCDLFLQAEVAEGDLHRFRGMPSVISDGSTDGLAADNKSDFGCFALPPIKYPNGKYRM